jgi:hypothetical protein
MRGLNDQLQQKMSTCLDLSYSRAVSIALAVEAKYAGPGKSKGFRGDRSNQGPEKRQRLVIRPFNQNRSSPRPPSYPFKQPVFIHPATAPTSTTQPSAPGTRFPALLSSSTGCFNCGKSRHFIKDCPYPKRNNSNNQQNPGSSSCGGQISPGSTRRLEDLAKGFGPDISQGHPFMGLGRNVRQSGSAQDRINSSPDSPTDSSDIHSSDPTFPRCVLRRRN